MSNSMETKNQTANQTKLNQMAEGQVLSDQTALDKEALQLSAYLLSYPSAEWREALTDVQAAWRAWPDSPLKESLGAVLDYISSEQAREYEDEYVRVFDFSGNTNMYLTSYDATNAEEQASELLEYKAFFQKHGYDIARELPDYVPAILELCSTLEPVEALEILQHGKEALATLRQRLIDGKQVHAFVLDVVLQIVERWEGTLG